MGIQPAVLSLISATGTTAGVASSAIGAYNQASSQKSALRHQAGIADMNARLAERSAQGALHASQQQVADLTLRAGQMEGRQLVMQGASGVAVNDGSALQVRESASVMKAEDVANLQFNALQSAFGYRTEAVNAKNDARMARATAKGISPGGAAVTSLLGGAGAVAKSWYQFGQAGGFAALPSSRARLNSAPLAKLGD